MRGKGGPPAPPTIMHLLAPLHAPVNSPCLADSNQGTRPQKMCQDNPPDTWGQLGTRGGIAGGRCTTINSPPRPMLSTPTHQHARKPQRCRTSRYPPSSSVSAPGEWDPRARAAIVRAKFCRDKSKATFTLFQQEMQSTPMQSHSPLLPCNHEVSKGLVLLQAGMRGTLSCIFAEH